MTDLRSLYLFLLVFICIRSSAQHADTANLVLRTGYCKPIPYPNPTKPDSVLFFREKDNELIAKVLMRQQRHFPVDLALPKGDYRVVYPNIYGETINKKCSFYNDTTLELKLCPELLVSYPENTLSRLVNKESLSVDYHSIGCFNNSLERLTITRSNGQLEARLYGEGRKKHLLIRQKKLNEKDIRSFVAFENELRIARKDGCTTRDYYSIRSKYWTCQVEDGSCSWRGFYTLKALLFGEHLPD